MLAAIIIAIVFTVGLCLSLRGEREDPLITHTPFNDYNSDATGARSRWIG